MLPSDCSFQEGDSVRSTWKKEVAHRCFKETLFYAGQSNSVLIEAKEALLAMIWDTPLYVLSVYVGRKHA